MGKVRSKLALRHRLVSQPEFYRNIVEPARREAAIEMTQSGNDHSDDRHLDVRPRMIEDQEIEACTPGDVDAGIHLLTGGFERAELRRGVRFYDRIAAWNQEWVLLQVQWRDAVEARFFSGAASHQTDREELIELGQRAQQGDASVEVRAGPELDIFMSVLHPVQYRHIGRNAEVTGDVEHPKPAAGVGELGLQIANIGIVEMAEVDFGPPQSIVPPDGVCIPLDQLEEALNDGFLQSVPGGAAIGIRRKSGRAAVEKI